jgi:hypothetical protein
MAAERQEALRSESRALTSVAAAHCATQWALRCTRKCFVSRSKST